MPRGQIQTTDAEVETNGGTLELVNTQYSSGDNAKDFELIKEARLGSSSAFKDLFNSHVNRVYAVCLRYSQDTDTADELTQEVFIKAWEKLHTFQFESKFSSWLYSIATNQFLMHKRSEKRFTERVNHYGEIQMRENPFLKPSVSHDYSMDVEAAMAKLPEQARMAFVLHDIEGYKHHEISEIMNIEVGTSKAHLHRARKILREELSK
jgi:RNA polymerase sigma-70 factor (ECF subfamily)